MSQDKKTHEDRLRRWMGYVDEEVRAVCSEKGWRHQVRRKLEVREKPVSESGIDDYEWKLIPDLKLGGGGRAYFVLGVDSARCVFTLQHDTFRVGVVSEPWCLSRFTEINLELALDLPWVRAMQAPRSAGSVDCMDRLPTGLLRRFLARLVEHHHPNHFSIT